MSIMALNSIPGKQTFADSHTKLHFILIVCFISLLVALAKFDSPIIYFFLIDLEIHFDALHFTSRFCRFIKPESFENFVNNSIVCECNLVLPGQ